MDLKREVDPHEVGLSSERLERVERHFAGYVERGLLPGWTIVIAREGQVAYVATCGSRDREAAEPVELDTIFRVYSMTKPITAVAALMLWEEGAFELKDPVSKFIPAFADTRVWRGGSASAPVTEPRREELAIWHLFTHTAGLTYGFMGAHPVDELYRRAGLEWGTPRGADLAAVCDLVAGLPLLFQPGAEWAYSMGIDVLGRVIEVASGQRLDEFLAERIFQPLGMVDTGFHVPEDQQHRLAALYLAEPGTGQTTRLDVLGRQATRPPVFLGGGGGLVSTASDYHRFMQLLAGRGELEGVRLLAPRTVRYLASNHLPGGADLARFGRPIYAETSYDGVGFGLGVSVTIDPVAAKVPGSIGDFGWGGLASTAFWVDPYEDLTVLFLTQLVPSSAHPVRSRLRQLVYQSLVG